MGLGVFLQFFMVVPGFNVCWVCVGGILFGVVLSSGFQKIKEPARALEFDCKEAIFA